MQQLIGGSLLSYQPERRKQMAKLAASLCGQWYDLSGRWIAGSVAPDLRKTLWLCFGLLAGEEESVRLANCILSRQEFVHHHSARTAEEGIARFDIFLTNHAIQLLVSHGRHLGPDVCDKLEGWARSALEDYPGNRQADYQFHGINDNMPAKATLGMILGGEYFQEPQAVEHGLWNLRQLRSLLTRRGLLSEYSSPTYTPLTLVNLTEIALHAKHPEARQLSTECCERIWADILGHFHPPTGTMGGPYSRAYQLDSTGHFSTMACLLWLVFGDRISFDPLNELKREPMRLVHHHNDKATQLGILCWVTSCPLDPPAHLLHWLENRSYPFHLLANAERGGETSGEINTTFYAEEDFALGTAEGEYWAELQSEVFFFQYRRRQPLRKIEDLRTAYTRYLIDSQQPGDRKEDHLLKPHGMIHTVHKDRVALVLAHPSLKLAGNPVSSLKFSFILPEHFGPVETVTVEAGQVFIKDGPVYLALRPLNATDWGREKPIEIETVPNYRMISFFNYKGPPRSFQQEELARTLNGFVSVVGLEGEESFPAFRDRVRQAEVLDYFYFGTRTISWKLAGTRLGMSYHLEIDRVRYRTINDQLAPRPIWAADGLPTSELPFLGGEPRTVNGAASQSESFPYRHLNVIWGESPWMIASNPDADSDLPILSANGWDMQSEEFAK